MNRGVLDRVLNDAARGRPVSLADAEEAERELAALVAAGKTVEAALRALLEYVDRNVDDDGETDPDAVRDARALLGGA